MADSCVVCGGVRARFVTSRAFESAIIELRRCDSCHTVFASTWDSNFPAHLYDYYHSLEGKPRSAVYDAINESRYDGLLKRLSDGVSGRRLLDVGCGIGQWVEAAARRGWDASGIELAEGAVRVAQSFGINVSRQAIESEMLLPGGYDVVTMFEVIEHVANPRAFLQRAASLLRPGGILLMTTPNFHSIDRVAAGGEWSVIHPEHFSYFTIQTITSLIQSTRLLELYGAETYNMSPALLRHRLRRKARLGSQATSSAVIADQSLRSTIERSRMLTFAKRALNGMLNQLRLGSAMTTWCRRV